MISSADASEATRTTAILTTMSEAALATSALLRDQGALKEINWTAKYSDHDFSFSASGPSELGPIQFTISGNMQGEEGSDFVVSYSGSGTKGQAPIQIDGEMEWRYDSAASDYLTMDFSQRSKFGANSLWGWVIGAEIGVGATIAAGGAVAGLVLTTGGVGGLLAVPVGIAAAGTGAVGFVGASSAIKTMIESEKPIPEPPAPKRPQRPKKGDKISPSKESIFTVVADDGQLGGDAFSAVVLKGRAKSGSVSGSLNSQ